MAIVLSFVTAGLLVAGGALFAGELFRSARPLRDVLIVAVAFAAVAAVVVAIVTFRSAVIS